MPHVRDLSRGRFRVIMRAPERFFDETTRDAHEGGWSSALDHLVEQFRRP
ncbi:hypothetical protein ACFPTO_23955 [Paraburkholderia denitrificans]|uniref:SRPBCC domain-containing protein n=1 Tax=Paraburkholderia denitrificans TaxID=694025 RepID=A0ABW0JFS3_9BURK